MIAYENIYSYREPISMVSMIKEKLESVESALVAIDSDEQLTEENVTKINAILDASEEFIKEV